MYSGSHCRCCLAVEEWYQLYCNSRWNVFFSCDWKKYLFSAGRLLLCLWSNDYMFSLLSFRSKSVLLSHGTNFYNLNFSTWDPHSIKHCPVRAYLKQPVTHVSARFTVRKTLVYNQLRCGLMPAAYSPYPAALLLFLNIAQTNWSRWDFVDHFCIYCEITWLFSNIAKLLF